MKRAFSLVELLVVVAIVVIVAAILLPVFSRPHDTGRRPACQSNLKQIGLGLIQYAQDASEKLPPARASSSTGWVDVVQPYVKSTRLFQCPSTTNRVEPLSDYFYNRRVAKVSLEKFEASSLTIAAGDGLDDAPTWNSIAQLPADWAKNSNSPARRHLDRGNYLFADGHVKALGPANVGLSAPRKSGKPTFLVR